MSEQSPLTRYREMIDDLGAPYFMGRELVQPGSPRHVLPRESFWPRIEGVLRLATELRERLGLPLIVAAAFRPVGGAIQSSHKKNYALDLDLTAGHRDAAHVRYFQKVCHELFLEIPITQSCGMGHYTLIPWRVHIDYGNPSRRRRTSWYYGTRNARYKLTIAQHGPSAARDSLARMEDHEIIKPSV